MNDEPIHFLCRRTVLASFGALGASLCLPNSALALTKGEAETLISSLVSRIFQVINSGKSEPAMLRDFEKVFVEYANVPFIARASLGVTARSVSKSDLRKYTQAFQVYVTRKYGRRFREFIGAEIKVTSTKAARRGYTVSSLVTFRGREPFGVDWRVLQTGGQSKMIDLEIEGISMVLLEREEIGAMLDKRGGSVAKLIEDLKRAG